MVRTQIQLQDTELRRLRRWARKLGISTAEAVRRCVKDQLDREQSTPTREEVVRAALSVCGKFRDPEGPRRLGRHHDKHLADILSS